MLAKKAKHNGSFLRKPDARKIKGKEQLRYDMCVCVICGKKSHEISDMIEHFQGTVRLSGKC